MVMVDQASGFLAAAPLVRRSAPDVIGAFHAHWVRPFGPPSDITADGAPEFKSSVVQDYLRRIGGRAIYSSPYNPQANLAETAVKKVKASLRKAMIDQANPSPRRLLDGPTFWTR